MADEAVLVTETELPVMMTVANATAIAKGSWLILANPMTVTVHAANDEAICAGIAAEEKIANDGKTEVSVYRGGIFKAVGSAAISTGESLSLSGTAQRLKKNDKTCLGMKTFGNALEDCGGNGETFIMEFCKGPVMNTVTE